MKKAILSILAICSVALVGCKTSTACWYPIDGGAINIDQVKIIQSNAQLLLWTDNDKNSYGRVTHKDTLINGRITEQAIENAILKLRNSPKNYTHANASAAILFDDFTVNLPSTDDIPDGWKNNQSLVDLLEIWLNAMDDVNSML